MLMMLMTIPDSDPLPLPSPPWLLWFLLILTFTLHVLAMNFILGGSIITAVARLRGGELPSRFAHAFGKAMPTVVAAAITLGVAPLLFVQALYGRLFFTSAVLMAWIWFAVVPLVMLAYYGAYTIAFRREGRALTVVAVFVALIFVGVAFIYSNNMSLMLRPDRFAALYNADGRGLHLNATDPTLVPRYLHMLFGAIAVGGMFAMLFGVAKKASDTALAAWSLTTGSFWFIAGTIANAVTGLWWLGTLPREVMLRFMGRDPIATIVLSAGVLFGLAALVLVPMRKPVFASSSLLLSLVTMVLTRDQVRRGMFALADFRVVTTIAPQWDVIALFAVLLVAALAATAWMVKIILVPAR